MSRICNGFRKRILNLAILATLAVALVAALGGCSSQPKAFTIGVVNISPNLDPVFEGFKADMADLGYVEGETVTYVYDGATGNLEGLAPVARKLVEDDVDLILAISTLSSLQAKEAIKGTDTPVVFVPVNRPVASGVVESLLHPGGNLTGIQAGGFVIKGLEWLTVVAPNTKHLYVPHNPKDNSSVQGLLELKEAATTLGIELSIYEAKTPEEMASATAAVPEGVDAIFLLPDSLAVSFIDDFAEASLERGLPLSAVTSQHVKAGALMSFGPGFFQMGQQAAHLADKVLQGVPPSDLPVETAEFFLSINLGTASSIDLDIADEILRQAHNIAH